MSMTEEQRESVFQAANTIRPRKPLGQLTSDEMRRLSTQQFRERYPEEFSEQERLEKLDLMNQVCSCGKRGIHWCTEHTRPEVAAPRMSQSWLKGQERYLVMDDGSVWEMRKQEQPEGVEPVLPYCWVLVCEGPKR